MPLKEHLIKQDRAVADAIVAEEKRQRENIVLIASENYTSAAILEAVGCVMTNKYAEGYPGRRYYGGCVNVDLVEQLAIDRAKELFGAEHANVQPHSGSQANVAAFIAMLQPGDKVMGLSLDHGGHLSHGSSVNISGRYYESQSYQIDRETERLDYDQIQKQAEEFRPKLLITGYSAYSRTIDFGRFRQIADSVGAYLLADIAHIAGLVAGKVHPSPVGHADIVTTTTHKTLRGPRGAVGMASADLAKKYNSAVFPRLQGGPLMHAVAARAVAFGEALKPEFAAYAKQIIVNAKAMAKTLVDGGLRIISGGTDNHLMLVDLQPAGLTGAEVEELLQSVGVVVNKNAIPFDPLPPRTASGVRIGTAAITARQMGEADAVQVAQFILDAIKNRADESRLAAIRAEVNKFASGFMLPGVDG